MQQGRHQRRNIEFPCGALGGYRNGMGDVRFAAFAHLTQMGGIGQFVGGAYPLDFFWLQIIQLR